MTTTDPKILSTVSISVPGASQGLVTDLTVREVNLVESLLTPGLQTSVKLHNFIHSSPNKNLDEFKNKMVDIEIERPILADYGFKPLMKVKQRIYRLSNRKLLNNQNEEFTLQACDDSLLTDAKTLVSKSWSCTSPTDIVTEVLTRCAGVTNLEVEPSTPPIDYIAKNIHPFRVVAQQANIALASPGEDPSFLHWMTYDEDSGLGIHHFKSLQALVRQGAVVGGSNAYTYAEVGNSYSHPLSIMTYNFPCDFDLLSDILNGIDVTGKNINTLISINPLSTLAGLYGSPMRDCGIGEANMQATFTNLGTAPSQASCPMNVEKYMLKRQARMNLLERDKIALKLTVPWNPMLHAGSMIEIRLVNKSESGISLYGSGEYLIVHMVHNIKNGGFSTTTMECVSKTAGVGVV